MSETESKSPPYEVERDSKGRIKPGSRPPATGRPKGSKNSSTLLKEALEQGFEQTLQKDFQKVLNAVVKEACSGNMQAAKLILDRAVPVKKAVEIDHKNAGGGNIVINVERWEAPKEVGNLIEQGESNED